MTIFQSEFFTTIFTHIQGTIGALSIAAPFLTLAIALEIILPGQKINVRSNVFNIIYTPIFLTISSVILSYLWMLIPKDIIRGIFNISSHAGYLQIIVFIIYLLVFDFCYYWLHRAQHQWNWLWKFHATHHSDPNVSALTTSRHHWLEDVFRFIPVLLPLSIIFGSLSSLPLWALVAPGLYGIFIHWNCPFQMRPIQKLIVTPWFHRVHHSIALEHRDKNFAVFFPFWDIIFGTAFFSDKSTPYPKTGIETSIPINSWRRLLPIPQQ
jgi:sterol desaturase/sphingolipid hydroxylase (fatty acid hydroxylase superfamily)